LSNDREKNYGYSGLKRPGRGDDERSYSGKCDVRLSAEEDSILSKLANDNGVTRSDVMRRALKSYARYCLDEE
jgi:hypothetical protein